MFHSKWFVQLALMGVLVLLPRAGVLAEPDPMSSNELMDFTGKLLGQYPWLCVEPIRGQLDENLRAMREASAAIKKAKTEQDLQKIMDTQRQASEKILTLLEQNPGTIQITIKDDKIAGIPSEPIALPSDFGAFLVKIVAGEGKTYLRQATADLSDMRLSDVPIKIAGAGTTWLFVDVPYAQTRRTVLELVLQREGGAALYLPVSIVAPDSGRLNLRIESAENDQPTPAMVSLKHKATGRDRRPTNAVEIGQQFDGQGHHLDWRGGGPPQGPVAGKCWWIVPGPLDMALPPGEYDIVIRRGIEHLPIFDTINVEPRKTVDKRYRLSHWVDMRGLGWYTGDDHVHNRIMSDDDARRLMAWIQAEDIHVANIVKMGDIFRTWFEQRGFGPSYRIIDGDYILCPGQECPRTHSDGIGHTLSMNIREMVRDTSKYFLYDWVFETVHKQGGLSGYAHIGDKLFNVQRAMSVFVPLVRPDFNEILQFSRLGTELYYEFLNLGYKMTASAGSDVPWGSTVGEVRLYAHVGKTPFTADAWFNAVRNGRTFVTNGPMLELFVDDTIPGDELVLSDNHKLRVRARAWSDGKYRAITKLEIVRHGEVIQKAKAPEGDQKELKLDFEIDGGDGCWIAARAEGSDGTKSHTTPVYVVRKGLRFWKYADVEDLIGKRIANLDDVVKIVNEAIEKDKAGQLQDNYTMQQLALQGPALLERVEAARKIYNELRQVAESERGRRESSK